MFGKPDIDELVRKKKVSGLAKAMSYGKETDLEARQIRKRAAAALGDLGDAEAVEALVEVLGSKDQDQDQDQEMILLAAEALGKIGSADAVDGLLTAMAGCKSSSKDLIESRKALYQTLKVALSEIAAKAGERASEALSRRIEAFQKGDERVVAELTELIAQTEKAAAKQMLGILETRKITSASVKDEKVFALRIAITTLGRLGISDASDTFIDNLGDARYYMLYADMVDALGGIADQKAMSWLGECLTSSRLDMRLRVRGIVALGRACRKRKALNDGKPDEHVEKAVSKLLSGLEADEPEICRAAAEALGDTGDEKAVRPLISLIETGSNAKAEAARSLGRLRDAAAVEPLCGLLRSSDRQEVLSALTAVGLIGDSRARGAVAAKASSDDEEVKAAAQKALSQLTGGEGDEGFHAFLLWQCPRCNLVLEKSPETVKFFQEGISAGRRFSGVVSCSGCQGAFPIEDVYSGRYDLARGGSGESS